MSGNNTFKAVAKGGGIGFVGMAVSALLQFVVGILIIRLLTKAEFGLISLGYVIVTILAMISSLGLINGVPRFLAKYRATNTADGFKSIAGGALSIAMISSVVMALLVVAGAEAIAALLSKPGLVNVVRAFGLLIPPLVMIWILTAIFRGIGQARPKLWFEDIAVILLRLALVIAVAAVGQHFMGVVFAYVSSVWIAAILYLTYARRKLGGKLAFNLRPGGIKNLLVFSTNLLGLSLIVLLMDQVAALILGYLQSAEQVAQYSAPLRLAQMLQIPLHAIAFLYLPFATTLYESAAHHELQELYLRVTKWTCFLAMPVFLAFLLDAEFIVVLLFGIKYIDSAPVLQMLAAGFFFNTLVGLNGQTLMSFGRTREIVIATISGLCANIILGMLLVPAYGALGSAMSVAGGLLTSNTIMSTNLALRYGINPFAWPYLRALLVAFLLALGIYFTFGSTLIGAGLAAHATFLILLCVISLVAPFLASSIDEADMVFLGSIERRLFHTDWLTSRLGRWIVQPSNNKT